jgi:hypothetical protein
MVSTGFIWLRMGTSGGILKLGIAWLSAELLVSSGKHGSVEVISV